MYEETQRPTETGKLYEAIKEAAAGARPQRTLARHPPPARATTGWDFVAGGCGGVGIEPSLTEAEPIAAICDGDAGVACQCKPGAAWAVGSPASDKGSWTFIVDESLTNDGCGLCIGVTDATGSSNRAWGFPLYDGCLGVVCDVQLDTNFDVVDLDYEAITVFHGFGEDPPRGGIRGAEITIIADTHMSTLQVRVAGALSDVICLPAAVVKDEDEPERPLEDGGRLSKTLRPYLSLNTYHAECKDKIRLLSAEVSASALM